MDIYNSSTGIKLIGIGEAVVLEVRSVPNSPAHQVKINHPDLGPTVFIPYVQTAGMYRAPRVGDLCYVFCNENFHQYPVAWGHRISEELAKQLVGNRADNITVIYSSGENNKSVSHKIELDDGANKGIRVTSAAGHKIEMKDASSLSVTNKDGSSITLNGETITLAAGGSTLSVGPAGIEIKSANGSTLKVNSTIEGKASDTKSKFDNVTVANHIHGGNLGYPTSPPYKGT